MSRKSFFGIMAVLALVLCCWEGTGAAARLHVEWCPCAGADGYKVYYGTTSGVYDNSWDNGTSTMYDSNPLPEGVYFVAVSAVYGTSEAFSSEKVVVAVENGDSAAGWSVLKGALPVPGYDALLSGNALYFNPVVTVAVAASKVSLANVPSSAVNLYYDFNATGSGGYVAVSMTTKSKGLVTLYYKLQDSNSLGTTTAILGIGSTMNDGQWHTIHRNLDDDLVAAGIAPAGDIVSFGTMYVYSYSKSLELTSVGFADNPDVTTCP